jgi:hypothetical protein
MERTVKQAIRHGLAASSVAPRDRELQNSPRRLERSAAFRETSAKVCEIAVNVDE